MGIRKKKERAKKRKGVISAQNIYPPPPGAWAAHSRPRRRAARRRRPGCSTHRRWKLCAWVSASGAVVLSPSLTEFLKSGADRSNALGSKPAPSCVEGSFQVRPWLGPWPPPLLPGMPLLPSVLTIVIHRIEQIAERAAGALALAAFQFIHQLPHFLRCQWPRRLAAVAHLRLRQALVERAFNCWRFWRRNWRIASSAGPAASSASDSAGESANPAAA